LYPLPFACSVRTPYGNMVGWAPVPHMSRYLPSLATLDLSAILDILVVAFLVYQALMVVRGTRAGHILIGILIMVGLYAMAWWAGLQALRSVLSFIVPYLGLAIIVLFQSEIRRTLARLGRKRWLGAGFHAPESLSEILMALEQFSEQKVGALIVLERDIGLRTFIESGVRLEARLSRDLLLSIFHPGLPLHDGASIVQKDRIAAAACFLPLTTNPAVSLKLGTRHRAAIGITEETDCLSLVVSEETGRISVASFGELVQGLTLSDVVDRVNRHFGVERPTPTQIDEFAADIPLAAEPAPLPAAGAHPTGARPAEKVNHP
jgi:diadenylate cyclase